jgi:hypothetical protein
MRKRPLCLPPGARQKGRERKLNGMVSSLRRGKLEFFTVDGYFER